jgi:quercetin dioxygenase-like cupin family protein
VTKPLATPGDCVELRSPTPKQDTEQVTVLVKTPEVEIIQILIPAGSNIPTHEAEGEIVLHCLKGRISVLALGEPRELKAGQLLYLTLNEPFSIRGIEQASVLGTIIALKQGSSVDLIGNKKPR